jgi:hypothetical protein
MYKVVLFLLLIYSCGSTKNQNSNQTKVTTIYTGTVHLNNNGCPYYIEINKCLVSNLEYLGKTIYPIQLDDKFKKDGLKLKFNFTVSRAMSPTDCQVDYVVSLENVSVSKK